MNQGIVEIKKRRYVNPKEFKSYARGIRKYWSRRAKSNIIRGEKELQSGKISLNQSLTVLLEADMWRTMRRAIFGSMVSISSLVKRSPALIDPMKPLIIKTFVRAQQPFLAIFLQYPLICL